MYGNVCVRATLNLVEGREGCSTNSYVDDGIEATEQKQERAQKTKAEGS